MRVLARKQVAHGSSPRLRGRVRDLGDEREHVGVIPAPTGKSSRPLGGRSPPRGHPRAYGEEAAYMRHLKMMPGSSPRLRGRVFYVANGRHAVRVIPAPTGKRASSSLSVSPRKGHPRAYGEEEGCVGIGSSTLGSSPRLRGRDLRTRQNRNFGRQRTRKKSRYTAGAGTSN